MAETAVVILNWNGQPYLERFLPILLESLRDWDAEVVVADNGSSDDSVGWLRARYPDLRVIAFDKNYGFAEGYNRALDEVEAEFYVLLNSDIEVTPGWLPPLTDLLKEDPMHAAVMPKIRSFHDRSRFEYAGACGGCIDFLGYPFCRGRVLDAVEEDRGQYDEVKEIFWATGACMVVRASVYREAGGLDSDFFAHQEEIDLCWRMQTMGYRILVEPRSVVYHIGGGTLAMESPFKVYLNFRNNLSMLVKNLSSASLAPVVLLRLVLDGLSAGVYLLQGRPKSFAAVFRAHLHFYRRLPGLMKKRKEIRRTRKKSPEGIYRGSIVWRYYTGRKTSPIR